MNKYKIVSVISFSASVSGRFFPSFRASLDISLHPYFYVSVLAVAILL